LDLISGLEEGVWWSLEAFVAALKEHHPDFQRPAGDYDSWFIQEKSSGDYLRGRGSWDKVDGALARYIIVGPMHWLGLVDLARETEKSKPAAFRLSEWAKNLWHGSPPDGLPAEDAHLFINMDGRMRVPPLVPRPVRYQAARFGEWESRKAGQYVYRVTDQSLSRAAEQGLRANHLLGILKKHASGGIPPAFQQTLQRWEKVGLQTRLITATVLQVDQPEILVELMKTSAKRFLGKTLNPTTVEVLQGGEEAVRSALLQMGYFSGTSKSFST
ncbi:MAG: helicase-associated domain-containing protein, partial [Anaerolineaceae bacterium]